MGQKTHPLGFRLGITQEHKSIWYANFNEYANLLEEDEQIRNYLNTLTKTASISDVKINRNGLGDQIQLNIETGRPGALVGENGSGIQDLLKNIHGDINVVFSHTAIVHTSMHDLLLNETHYKSTVWRYD